jgi:hypothetical protein
MRVWLNHWCKLSKKTQPKQNNKHVFYAAVLWAFPTPVFVFKQHAGASG